MIFLKLCSLFLSLYCLFLALASIRFMLYIQRRIDSDKKVTEKLRSLVEETDSLINEGLAKLENLEYVESASQELIALQELVEFKNQYNGKLIGRFSYIVDLRHNISLSKLLFKTWSSIVLNPFCKESKMKWYERIGSMERYVFQNIVR